MAGPSINDLEIYKEAIEIGNWAWEVFSFLPKELKYNIGDQLIRSADSVGANIAEGYGRYHYKDSMKFYYNARASLSEVRFWVNRLEARKLIEKEESVRINSLIHNEYIKINNFISYLKRKSENQAHEDPENYDIPNDPEP